MVPLQRQETNYTTNMGIVGMRVQHTFVERHPMKHQTSKDTDKVHHFWIGLHRRRGPSAHRRLQWVNKKIEGNSGKDCIHKMHSLRRMFGGSIMFGASNCFWLKIIANIFQQDRISMWHSTGTVHVYLHACVLWCVLLQYEANAKWNPVYNGMKRYNFIQVCTSTSCA